MPNNVQMYHVKNLHCFYIPHSCLSVNPALQFDNINTREEQREMNQLASLREKDVILVIETDMIQFWSKRLAYD